MSELIMKGHISYVNKHTKYYTCKVPKWKWQRIHIYRVPILKMQLNVIMV